MLRVSCRQGLNVQIRRWLSTTPPPYPPPSSKLLRLVSNVTEEKIAANPELEAFMKANFPQEMDPDNYKPVIPPHVSKLNSFGLKTEEEIKQESKDDVLATTTLGMDIDPQLKARNIRPMITYLRHAEKETNSRRSRGLRYHKLIPGLLYGGDPTRGIHGHQASFKTHVKTPWQLIQRELGRFRLDFSSRVYALTVLEKKNHSGGDEEGEDVIAIEPQLVVPANVQRHPVEEKLYCVNYVRYHAQRPLQLPLVHVNTEESPAMKRDGFLIPIQRRIECFVEDGVPIPQALELECTGLQYKDVVRKDRLILPDGVRLSDRVIKRGDNYVIAVVDGGSRGGETTTTTTTTAETADTTG